MPTTSLRLIVRIVTMALVLGLGLPALTVAGPASAATAGLPLSGQVTASGVGVAGVEVTVFEVDREEAVAATATTNADGEYGVAELEPGDYEVVATPAADDPSLLATAARSVTVGSRDEVLDLSLEVSNVRGVVSRSDGSPAPGAAVEMSTYGLTRATTYPDGSFRFAVPQGEWELTALPPAENPALDVGTVRTVVVEDAVAGADVALVRPNVRGTVLAPDGTTAVAGARVQLTDRYGGRVPGGTMTSRSDGSYAFSAPAGVYRLDVEAPAVNPEAWVGYVSEPIEVLGTHTPAAPLVRSFDLRGPTVSGVVRAPDGDPVPRARVHVWSDVTGAYSRQRADATGHYGISVPAGGILVGLNAPVPTQDHLDHEFHLDIPETPYETDLFFLRPNVTGRVVTADGLPVRNAQIRAFGPDPDGTSKRYATTDRQGRFALYLAPGTTQRVVADPEVSSPAGIRTAASVEVPGDGEVDIEIELDPAPASSYDVVPLEVTINDREVVRMDHPAFSNDGTVVAVRVYTTTCDCAGRQDGRPSAAATDPGGDFAGIVLHDRRTGEDEPLLAPNGEVIDPLWYVALDDDASTVAFLSGQDDLVADDTDPGADAFVLDRETGTLTRLDRPEDGHFDTAHLVLSDDGSRLALGVAGVTSGNHWNDLAVIDLDGTGAEVSRRIIGLQTREIVEHDLSGDGSTLAWTQFHRGAPGNGDWNLHVLDLASGEEDPLRPFSEGVDGWNGTGGPPSLSDDGSVVAYADLELFETPGGYDQWPSHIRIADRAAGTDRVADPFDRGADPVTSSVSDFELSGTGAELLVTSRGGAAEESSRQAWVVDLSDDDAELVSRTASGAPASDGVEMIAAPSDFSALALSTESGDLSGSDEQYVVLAVAEIVAPQWPDDAAVVADAGDIGATSVRLHWTEATDNVAVTGYRVLSGDTVLGTTNGATRQLRVTGLTPDTSYTFTVQALDARSAVSTDGPSVTVRTLPEDSTELRPLDATARPGGVVDLAWEVVSGVDELVLRTYLGDTQIDERALVGTATTAQERGLAANAAYSFQVFARTGATVRAYTERVDVTTNALSFGSLTWTVPTVPSVRPEVARRGSTATITATAETGRDVSVAVEHLSWYDAEYELLDEPRTVTSVVPLTEVAGTPGSYRGGFELVDGVARIVGMLGTVADGHGGTLDRASTRAPIRVSTSVVLTVDAPEDSIFGQLQLFSEATGQTLSEHLSGGATFSYEHLKAANDYVVQITDDRGRTLAERTALRVRDGLSTAVTSTPRLPARLRVDLSGPDGGTVDGARVDLTDADTGEFIGSRWPGADGSVQFWDVLEDQRVQLDLDYPSSSLLQVEDPRTIVLDVGDNEVDIVARDLARHALTGTVRYDDGRPASGTTVTLRQQHRGEQVTISAEAEADGRYEIAGLRGTGELRARSGAMRAAEPVDLTAGPVEQDIELSGPRMYDARLRLFVRPAGAGSETGPVPLDWRTAVHYGLTLTVDGVDQRLLNRDPEPDGSVVVAVQGSPGQVLRLCISGYEARLQSTCLERVLTAGDRSPVLEMHAGPGVDVSMSPVDAAGEPVRDASTAVYETRDSGRAYVSDARLSGRRVVARVPRAGTYVVRSVKDDLSVERTFTVTAEDHSVDLGDLVLRRRAQFTGPDNTVVASRSDVLPGGDVEMRASWRNRGAALTGVVARIAVPSDTQLLTDSVILDGRPVPTTAGVGYVDVDLGAVAADGTGALRYRLRAATDATGIPGRVDLRYPGPGGVVVEPLESVAVPVVSVTVSGPATVSGTRIPLDGRAPAGRLVTITDGGTVVGSALAGPGGRWRANVPLVEQPRHQPEHQLSAAVEVSGERFFDTHEVLVDETRPTIESISMYQLDAAFENGRRATFDPLDGVARFPFVFVPYQPLRVEVTFDQPSLVSRADVLIGQLRIPAQRRGNGVFVAEATLNKVGGPIRVDFDAIAKPIDMGEAEQSEREVRDSVPPPLRDFEISDVQQPSGSGSGARVGAFTASIPGAPGSSVRSTLTVTRETYTPTADDIAMQRATGSAAYDAHVTRSGNTINTSMVIPLSEIPGVAARAEADGTEMGRALAAMLRDAIGPESVARAGAVGVGISAARIGYQVAFTSATGLDSILSALGSTAKLDKLSKVIDAATDCSPGTASAYIDRAETIANLSIAADIAGLALVIGGIALAPATFGLGTLAIGVAAWAIDKAISYAIDQATDNLMNEITSDAECEDEEEDEDDEDDLPEPVADPVWIFDPSGYVYEGARSTRISGVTATLLTAPTENGPWTRWDAEWFDQTNPQVTDNAGRYGWDVPEGWWKVAFTKEGYRTTSSRVLRVLPPHLDVDVSMVKEGFPHVTGSVLRDGRVEVTFDRLVRSATAARSLTVTDAAGTEVPGTWGAIGATTGDADLELQRGLRFTPTATLRAGSRVTLGVDGVADYSGRLMAAPYTATLTVPSAGGGGPGGPSRQVPDAPTTVVALALERAAAVTWTAPDDHGSELLDYVVTTLPGGRQVVVDAGETSVEIGDLAAGTEYAFTVTARNEVGTSAASEPSNAVVPTAEAPRTVLETAPVGFVVDRSARLTWADTGASYVCELDGEVRPCTGTGTTLSGLRSGTHTFSVAAVDQDGDADPTPATATWTVPRDDRALAGDRSWQRRRHGGAFDATYSQASARGATLTARVRDATGLALVVARGRGHGKVAVFLGRERLATVDLGGTARQRQLVALRALDGPRSGTVRVVVTSRRGPVRIDGLAVSTAR